jgi:hypothetical protein
LANQTNALGQGKLSAVKVYSGRLRLAEKIASAISAVTKKGLDRYTRVATWLASFDGVATARRTHGSLASSAAPSGVSRKSWIIANC